MSNQRRFIVWATVITTLAVLATASGCTSTDSRGPQQTGNSGQVLRVANPLIREPLAPVTIDTNLTRILDIVWTGLVRYDDKLEPYNAMAKSIKSTDGKKFDIVLNEDYKFTDGTPVNASSYIDAWNYAAYGPNAAQSASYFSLIAGYSDLNPLPAAGATTAPKPTTDKLAGLQKVSEFEFTVELSKTMMSFPAILGYSPFYPLPTSYFKDPAAFAKEPITNGPYKVTKVVPGQEVQVVRDDDYKHDDAGKVAGIDFINSSSDTAAYTAVQGGQLDFAEVPTANLRTFKADFPDRYAEVIKASMMDMQVPLYQKKYEDVNVRIALSMAIDRESITTALLPGQASPADGWVPPAIFGYEAGACGANCEYNPKEAKKLWAQTGFTGDVIIGTLPNMKTVFTGVCQSITDTLGVPCKLNVVNDKSAWYEIAQTFAHPGPFHWGWNADYPTMENFLGPKFGANRSSNWMKYDSADFQNAIDIANAEPNGQKSFDKFNEVQAVMAREMPSIPLYFRKAAGVWSENTSNVILTPFGWPDLLKITKG